MTATQAPPRLDNPSSVADLPADGHADPAAVDNLDLIGHDDGEVAGLVDRLTDLVGDTRLLAGLDASGLKARAAALRRLSGLAEAGMAATVAALDDTGVVGADGAPSAAEWLKAHGRRSGHAAARTARLADRIDDLPATVAALAAGRICPEAADVIVNATADDLLGDTGDVEADLLKVAATATPARLRRHATKLRQAASGATLARDEKRQRALREASMVRRDDGMWRLRALLSDEAGTKFRTALDALDVATDATKRRPAKRLADALEAIADRILDHGLAPATGGIARPHLAVTVDLDTLTADLTRPDTHDPHAPDAAVDHNDPAWDGLQAAATSWGGLLSPQAIRRIACDATLARVVMDAESQVLDVGRATRNWSGPQRTAVNARDRGCRGPSCTRPIAWTHIHHIRWWTNGGHTAVDNGIALCHHCHRLVHDHDWTIHLDTETAAATWTSPTGKTVTTHPHHHTTDNPHHQRRRQRR